MKRFAVLAILLALAMPAGADVWRDAIDGGTSETPGMTEYRRAMQDGDDHVRQALASMVSPGERKRQVDLAIESYRQAEKALPRMAEPHFRIAATIDAFFVCSKRKPGAPPMTQQELFATCDENIQQKFRPLLVAEWDIAEQLAPLDPRFSSTMGDSILFERAIQRTHMGTRPALEAAARDYVKVIERSDEDTSETVYANLAETYMMLGRLEDSIELYDKAVEGGADQSVLYGLAVALDRNGQTIRSRQTLDKATLDAAKLEKFRSEVMIGRTFFVPRGEEFFYYALLEEYLEQDLKSLEHWKMFVASGAHPQYQPVAKRHIEALQRKIALHPPLLRSYEPAEEW